MPDATRARAIRVASSSNSSNDHLVSPSTTASAPPNMAAAHSSASGMVSVVTLPSCHDALCSQLRDLGRREGRVPPPARDRCLRPPRALVCPPFRARCGSAPGCRAGAPAGRSHRGGRCRPACDGPRRGGPSASSSSRRHGPAAIPAPPSAAQASSLVLSEAHPSIAGRRMSSRWSSQPCRVASRESDGPLGLADDLGQALEVVLPADLHDEPAVLGPEAVVDQRARCHRS